MKKNRNSGFSLAELLIVVAIVVVLMAVAFVAVQNYQSSMTRLEFDTIAKEIFIAAQNHLTTAENQGYPQNISFGHDGEPLPGDDETAEIWYVVSSDSNTLKEIMLPDYALDGMALSGSYIIRYQPYPATVLDVFYSREGKSSFLSKSGTTLSKDDYTTLMGDSPNYRAGGEKNRENYNGKVIGWYGGAAALAKGERLKTPTFEIINAEKLLVKVSNLDSLTDESGYTVKLIVRGEKSGAEAYFSLIKDGKKDTESPRLSNSEENTIILDSITDKNKHFDEIVTAGKQFFPGEDLQVKVVAYNTKVLSNVAMSAEKITNSLFADPYPYTGGEKIRGSDIEKGIAGINNIRHLENLDVNISNYDPLKLVKTTGTPNQGVQLRDLSWTDFKQKTDGDSTTIHPVLGTVPAAAVGTYYPVSPGYVLAYKGQNYTISDISVSIAADAGLFGTLSAGSSVSDLKLVDFSIASTSAGNAGALVGSALGSELSTCTISNILAQNSTGDANKKITSATTRNAGGLIGEMTGGTVQFSAAAVIVGDDTAKPKNAGGLIGTMTGGTINGCYSGGHTEKAGYFIGGSATYNEDNTGIPTNGKYNVIGATAGGLIGNTSAAIRKCYSTCSASGTEYAGGFAGVVAGGSIEDSYSTGLVSGSYDLYNLLIVNNAFLGSLTGEASFEGNHYYQIINEVRVPSAKGSKSIKIEYKGSGGSSEHADLAGITPFDSSKESFESFIEKYKDAGGEEKPWTEDKPAKPYDDVLETYYKEKYFLPTVAQLGASVPNGYFVKTHYGDWPAPEIFIINSNS